MVIGGYIQKFLPSGIVGYGGVPNDLCKVLLYASTYIFVRRALR